MKRTKKENRKVIQSLYLFSGLMWIIVALAVQWLDLCIVSSIKHPEVLLQTLARH